MYDKAASRIQSNLPAMLPQKQHFYGSGWNQIAATPAVLYSNNLSSANYVSACPAAWRHAWVSSLLEK